MRKRTTTWAASISARDDMRMRSRNTRKPCGLNPQLVEARYNIGVCNQALGPHGAGPSAVCRGDSCAARLRDGTLQPCNHADRAGAAQRTAEMEFKEALRLMPEFAPAHDGLGFVLLQTGQIPDAVTEFKEATRIQPDYAPAHYKLAVTLAAAGLAEEALEEFRDAVRYAPTSPEMHFALGSGLASVGRLEDAALELNEAIRLRPDYPEAKSKPGTCETASEGRGG